ncbi:RGS3-like protein [Mya arenaria]|uniref:RGS3-like protein n=1 Tax=Mya arenaria TaxID=6604 RepID=A0ABY7FL47_MYAAR|nr:RGS3-like protein [Mya arenaria]
MGLTVRQLRVTAYVNHGLVTVHVVQGRHLTSGRHRQPDTFVMISLIPDRPHETPTRCRTEHVPNTSCPIYDEKFSFEVSEEDEGRRLLIAVWGRKSHSGPTETFGCMSFGLRHLQSGERPVSGWYHLLTEDVGCKKHLKFTPTDRPLVPVMQSHIPRSALLCTSVHEIPKVNKLVSGSERLQISVQRSPYGGFGFSVVDACPVRVSRVDSTSRAEEAGLHPGDLIVRVNGQNVSRSTSTSVARCIKRSGQTLVLEVQRPAQIPTARTPFYANVSTIHEAPVSDNASLEEWTLCEDHNALEGPGSNGETRRQAALHGLLVAEERFVEAMSRGMQSYSRPLRHGLLAPEQHSALFQNVEKLVSISEYQVHQMLSNLPDMDDAADPDDSQTADPADITTIVGIIYRSKLPLILQAYTLYTAGLPRAASSMATLEKDPDFLRFLWHHEAHNHPLSLCEFINRPLEHLADVCRHVTAIRDSLSTTSPDHGIYCDIVNGLQSVVSTVQSVEMVSSSFLSVATSLLSVSHTTSGSTRHVPRMGARILKHASSSSSSSTSSSGFGSGGSQQSDDGSPSKMAEDR